jgi:hypothetical protein
MIVKFIAGAFNYHASIYLRRLDAKGRSAFPTPLGSRRVGRVSNGLQTPEASRSSMSCWILAEVNFTIRKVDASILINATEKYEGVAFDLSLRCCLALLEWFSLIQI